MSPKMIGDEDRAPTLADHCWSIQQGALLQTSVNLAIVVCATLDGMGTYPEFEDASFMVIFDIISLSIFLFDLSMVCCRCREACLRDTWSGALCQQACSSRPHVGFPAAVQARHNPQSRLKFKLEAFFVFV